MPPVQGAACIILFLIAMGAAGFAQDNLEESKKEVIAFTQRELGFTEPRLGSLRAVRTTLDYSPQILLQDTDVQVRKGGILIARGEFDTHVIANNGITLTRTDRDLHRRGSGTPPPVSNPAVKRETLAAWELGVRKKLRNGIILEPSVGYRRTASSDLGAFQNRGEFGFDFAVLVPLAKGSGNVSNEAPEIAAKFDYQASLYALRQVTAQSVFATMAAYWQCRAAEERYKLFRQTEDISSRLVSLTDALVKAGQLGSSQLSQILADQSSTVAQRIASEQELILARQRLAVTIGDNPLVLAQAPLVEDSFPEPKERMAFPEMHELTSIGLALRDDLRAAKLLIKSRKVLVEASELNLRPTVNLQLDARYAPFVDHSSTLNQDGGIWSGTVGVHMDWPVENSIARGLLIQDTAIYERSKIDEEDLSRNIVSNIITTLTELRGTASQVLLLKEAAAQHDQALQAQEELFSHGQANLTDVITARQRLIGSQLEYVNARQNYATSIVQLRLQSGTLLPWSDSRNWVSSELWITLPFVKSEAK